MEEGGAGGDGVAGEAAPLMPRPGERSDEVAEFIHLGRVAYWCEPPSLCVVVVLFQLAVKPESRRAPSSGAFGISAQCLSRKAGKTAGSTLEISPLLFGDRHVLRE
jgi:hypothetical protein